MENRNDNEVTKEKNSLYRDRSILEKQINELIYEYELKYKNDRIFIAPITINFPAYNKQKGGRIQLAISRLPPDFPLYQDLNL